MKALKRLREMDAKVLRNYAMFLVGFFLVSTVLTAVVVIPKINRVVSEQHLGDIRKELDLEVALFSRFIENQKRVLDDFARFPSVTSSVMLSDANNSAVHDLFENTLIEGAKARLVLQDIDETILIQTVPTLRGTYTMREPWATQLLEGSIPYYFKLLRQARAHFDFQLSVPVTYRGNTEGILSAEITVPIEQAFATHVFGNTIAIRLSQGGTVVTTDMSGIDIPQEISVNLSQPSLRFTFITDAAPMREKEYSLNKTIYSTLLSGLCISFLLFAALGYFHLTSQEGGIEFSWNTKGKYAFPIFVGAIGIAATLSIYMLVASTQQSSIEKTFITDAKVTIRSVRAKIESAMSVLDAVAALYHVSDTVSRKQFRTFVSPLLEKHNDIQALEWIPSVLHEQRKFIENQALKDGFTDFRIREKNGQGAMVPAGIREGYFPVFYVEPLTGNERALGFDLASDEKRLSSLLKARQSGDRIATAGVNLVQDATTQTGILVFHPIMKHGHDLPNAGMPHLGFVLLVLRLNDMMNGILGQRVHQLPVTIHDITEPDQYETLFTQNNSEEAPDYSETIDLAGRKWEIGVSNLPSAIAMPWVSWMVFTTGLMFSAMVALGLAHLTHRRQVLEDLVKKRTKELALLVDKLTNSNEELSRFAFVCSHDLQEPLRMIRSFSEKLQLHISDDLESDERGKKYFRFITEGACRAQELISDILSYSSIDADVGNLEDVNMSELIQAIKENMQISLEENGGKITCSALPTLRGNKTQLFQLLNNLINNGLKYQRAGKSPHVHIGVEDSGDHWKFSVLDNGIGIEQRHIGKIFDVFQRLHRKSQFSGTGIGLSICKKVVERHNGKIWVISETGIGSIFYFTLLKPNHQDRYHE